MTEEQVRGLLQETAYVRMGGSAEELRTAKYLIAQCEARGVAAHIEPFPVQMATVREAHLYADGIEIPCLAYRNCGSCSLEAPFYYMPGTDPVSLAGAKGKIVLVPYGLTIRTYDRLINAGAAGIITYNGDINQPNTDIDNKELRDYVARGRKLPAVNLHVSEAVGLVERETQSCRIVIDQEEYMGESRDVVAEIPGETEDWLCITAHYDSTPLSAGAYDNMTGCIGLLGIMEALAASAPHRLGCRFIFCGSEERGLLGSKAWVRMHAEELDRVAMDINLDMVGTYMGPMRVLCSCEQSAADGLKTLSALKGFPLEAIQGVHSSDSSPFAHAGVPAVSFSRRAGNEIAPIHNRYDTMKVVSPKQILADIGFISGYAKDMADAYVLPIPRQIPDNVAKWLDDYINGGIKWTG